MPPTKTMKQQPYTLLALGDSYTIGESVMIQESFPYQVVQALRKKGIEFHGPEILAKTGWTTDELLAAMKDYQFLRGYDWVTLLIGVNNQYRGRPLREYEMDLEILVNKALDLAGGHAGHLIILSIPDWGVTPFAKGRDRAEIAREIDQYNTVKREMAAARGIHYIDITPGTRQAVEGSPWIAADGLHPSAREYARWAEAVSGLISNYL